MQQTTVNVYDFVKLKGPVIPADVSKNFGMDLIFAGAMLSELVANKSVLISKAKIGGSPVYYVHGQESRLNILYSYLPQKEKEAYDLLKKDLILMDKNQQPSIRVALRNLKDFAKSLVFKINNLDEIIWKWYLAPEDIVGKLLKEILNPNSKQQTLIEENKQEIKIEEEEILIKEPIVIEQIVKKTEPNIRDKKDFTSAIQEFIKDKKVNVINTFIIRKNNEIHMEVKIPSEIGELKYYMIAKNKKKINEGDLSLAYYKGQEKKLPVLFLCTGELTKKGKEHLEKDFKNLTFKKI